MVVDVVAAAVCLLFSMLSFMFMVEFVNRNLLEQSFRIQKKMQNIDTIYSQASISFS